MARPSVYNWLPADDVGIALLQSTAGAGDLILNGSLVNFDEPVFASFPGITRVVSLTSAPNNSAINFTISGTVNGVSISETISGPNSNTVESIQWFDTVTSISVDGAVTDVSVGSGSSGYTHWFSSNYHSSVTDLAVSVNITGTINYTFQTTLDEVDNSTSPGIVLFEPIDGVAGSPAFPADMVGQTADQLAYLNAVTRFSRILINSSSGSGKLVAIFLQQGIT